MKSLIFVIVTKLIILSSAQTDLFSNQLKLQSHNAFGYFGKIGIAEAEKVYRRENSQMLPRIVGGEVADVVRYNYQAGLLISLKNLTGTGLCGGALISADRVSTAAHCWFDGLYQGKCMTVILGSEKLFSGGTRIRTCDVHTHPGWDPSQASNDVAVVYLPSKVTFSGEPLYNYHHTVLSYFKKRGGSMLHCDTIAPCALPSKSDLHNNFIGELVIASGYGKTGEYIPVPDDQVLSKVNLVVISNKECLLTYPGVIRPSNICTGSTGASHNVAICSGDSGGPLVITRNGTYVLIGIASFGPPLPAGCDSNLPNGFSRVTHFMDFFEKHMTDS